MMRPTKMTEGRVQKLLVAFGVGSNVAQACLLAEISRQTYYSYVKENPEFLDRKEDVKGLEAIYVKMRWMQIMETGDVPTVIELGKYILEHCDPAYQPKHSVLQQLPVPQPRPGTDRLKKAAARYRHRKSCGTIAAC